MSYIFSFTNLFLLFCLIAEASVSNALVDYKNNCNCDFGTGFHISSGGDSVSTPSDINSCTSFGNNFIDWYVLML